MTTTLTKKPNTKKENVEIVAISPTVAAAWLDRNKKNRKVSTKIVNAYARDIASGKWRLSGDAIRFDRNGDLVDGQHRLLACIKADAPFETLVVYGLHPDVINVIDGGKPRRAADVLAMKGLHNPIILTTAARWVLAYKQGHARTNSIQPTTEEILAVIDKHKHLPHSANQSKGVVGAYPGLVAFVYYVARFMLKQEAKAEKFVEVFKSGVPSYENCPAHNLREHLIRRRGSGISLTREEHFNSLIHAWNLFAADKPAQRIRSSKTEKIDGLDATKL